MSLSDTEREYQREYKRRKRAESSEHRERDRLANRRSYNKLASKRREERVASYRENPQPQREASKRWTQNNPERAKANAKRWRSENPERAKEHQIKSRLKQRYGLTLEQLAEMRASQGGVCAICPEILRPGRNGGQHIDHCHRTGKVRGLLCARCNWFVGFLESKPEALAPALAYLEKHK